MKRTIAIIVMLTLLAMLAVPALAEGETELGSITINNVSVFEEAGADGSTVYKPVASYGIYQILVLESYNASSGAYSYTVATGWEDFFASDDAKLYVSVDATSGYVTWNAGDDQSKVAEFAKLALAFADEKGIDPAKTTDDDDHTIVEDTLDTSKMTASIKFSDLPLGYYLVDSSMGALCGLTTTNPNASINTKNGTPTIDKQVQEDSTQQWAESNTADIGQTIYYRVTINVHEGAQNYVFHDVMDGGLTYKAVTKIEHVVPGTTTTTTDVATSDYEVKTENLADGCTFEIHFSEDFCNNLETNDKVIIYYEAMLNRSAVIAGDGNINEAWLSYGDHHNTTSDTTTTYTYGIDIIKTDSQNTLIDGAQFKIYDALTGGNEVKVVLMDDGVTYRLARSDENGVAIVVKDGKVRVVGLDNGTYYLEETQAPDGYNKLTARQRFIISDGNLDATFNGDIYSSGSGVHVVNKTGSMLPETGGLGTLLFTVLGGGAVMGSGVLLVTKKRMSKIEDEE